MRFEQIFCYSKVTCSFPPKNSITKPFGYKPSLPLLLSFLFQQLLGFHFGLVTSFIVRHKISLSFRCVLFMWFFFFSDLHALEVELWIHCFCTRLRPFKSSECYRFNLCLVWRFSVMSCFLTTFQTYSFICPRQTINLETWLNTVWNLDWI